MRCNALSVETGSGKTHLRHSASSACFWSGPVLAEGIMASGFRVPHQQAAHMAAPTEGRTSKYPCQGRAVHTWRKADVPGGCQTDGGIKQFSGHIMADPAAPRPRSTAHGRCCRPCSAKPVSAGLGPLGYDRSRKGLRSCRLQGHASVRSRIALHDGFRGEWPSKLTRVFSPTNRRTGIDDGLTIPTTWPTFISLAGFRKLLQLRFDC